MSNLAQLPGCFKPDESVQQATDGDIELPDEPPAAPSWPAPWDPERLDRRAAAREGEKEDQAHVPLHSEFL